MKFLFVFTLVLLACLAVSSANRVPRDAPKVEDAPKVVENVLAQFQEFMKDAFSQEKMEQMKKQLQDVVSTVGAKGKEILEQMEAKKAEATK